MILVVNKCEFSFNSNKTSRIYQLPNHKPNVDVFGVDGPTVFNNNGRDYDEAKYSSNDS